MWWCVGPFPTELNDSVGEALRAKGHEFGTTTGRPRRCGWLDIPVVQYSHALNAYASLNITKLDVLSDLAEIKIGVAYKLRGKVLPPALMPSALSDLSAVEVVYESTALSTSRAPSLPPLSPPLAARPYSPPAACCRCLEPQLFPDGNVISPKPRSSRICPLRPRYTCRSPHRAMASCGSSPLLPLRSVCVELPASYRSAHRNPDLVGRCGRRSLGYGHSRFRGAVGCSAAPAPIASLFFSCLPK